MWQVAYWTGKNDNYFVIFAFMSSMNDNIDQANHKNQRKVLIDNRLGLHARAAAKFVRLAEVFESEVWVIHNGIRVSGVSILGLMMLAAAPGTELTLEAQGVDSGEVLDALVKLIGNKFDED